MIFDESLVRGGQSSAAESSSIGGRIGDKFRDLKLNITTKFDEFSYNVRYDRKTQIILISVCVGVVALLALILGLVFGLRSGSKKEQYQELYVPLYPTITRVPYYAETIGKYQRVKPIAGIHNEGLCPEYPKYGYTLRSVIGGDNIDKRHNLISESSYLAAYGTSTANTGQLTPDKYTWMNKEGYLFQGNVTHPVKSNQTFSALRAEFGEQRRLYKHNGSIGNYLGDVLDSEEGVIKRITLSPRSSSTSYSVTGLYAPPGEVIKVEFSKEDMEATGGLIFHIGQALYNAQCNNIWAEKNQMQRMPHLLTTLKITKTTATLDESTNTYTGYIGSFIGGPIYIRSTSAVITVTISGAVPYPHFILGVTTPEIYEENLNSSAPFFDLEVWDRGVLHSGPRHYSDPYSYDQIYAAAILWDKVASVTTYNNNQGIVFLFDPFVAAGAAVAFPGRSSVNCPSGWMTQSLNYNSIVTSGAWGNFHEYHHNFQGYGVGNGGEVTNNGLSLVSYALFTKVSSSRGIGNYASQGLGGWNSYTSAVFALSEVSKIKYSDVSPSNGNQGLALYACLLHNLGPDAYIKVKGAGGGQSYLNYMNKWQEETHNNMYYYFNELLGGTGISDNADGNYSIFVPVSCVFQTGRSFLYYNSMTGKYEKKYFKSMRPYLIPYGKVFDIDLTKYTLSANQYQSGSILFPTNPDKTDRFTYTVKSVSKPQNGRINKVDEFHYQYCPDEKQSNYSSGEIIVTLGITDKKGELKVDDVDLILEFELTHEALKTTLQRTIYTYDESKMYVNATDAFNNKFSGYETVEEIAHTNPTQNSNTDIWHYPNSSRPDHPNDPEHFFVHENQVEVVDGKLYFAENGIYRIFVRGRTNLAVYYSLDGKQYELGATITKLYTDSANFHINDNLTYFDIEFADGGNVTVSTYQNEEILTKNYEIYPDRNGDIRNFLYVKEVLIEQSTPVKSYIGLGFKEWIATTFVLSTNILDKNNQEVAADSPDAYVSWTNYTNYLGAVVAYKKEYIQEQGEVLYKQVDRKLVEIELEEFLELTKEEIIPPTSYPTYANGYRSTYEFPDNKAFETNYFYTRTYGYSYTSDPILSTTWDEDVTLISTNFVAESDQYAIDNLFTGNFSTFIHPNANTARGTYFNIDMGKKIQATTITFNGRIPQAASTNKQGFPSDFALYISNDNITYEKVGDFHNSDGNGNNAERAVNINIGKTIEFRYINITIESSHSNTGRIILSRIKFTYTLSLPSNSNNVKIINSDEVKLYGQWETKLAFSTFGRVHIGTKGSRVKFDFTGTRLGVITSKKFATQYEVRIDGNKVNSINVKKPTLEYGISYISEKLGNGNHHVEIECTGEANFDCFAYFTDPE